MRKRMSKTVSACMVGRMYSGWCADDAGLGC